MNNYFGIGLDAKIALEFHNKREESADKTRSRRYVCPKMSKPRRLRSSCTLFFQQALHVVRDAWNERASAKDVQESGTASASGMRWASNSATLFARHCRLEHSEVWPSSSQSIQKGISFSFFQLSRRRQLLGQYQIRSLVLATIIRRSSARSGSCVRRDSLRYIKSHSTAEPSDRPVPTR